MTDREPPTASRETYQKVYDQNPRYSCAATGSSPAVRLLPHYVEWLVEPVLDFGCGTGETVMALRDHGIEAEGIDWIKPRVAMESSGFIREGDITEPVDAPGFLSALCIDVIEHIEQPGVLGLLGNLSRFKRQVITINNASSVNTIDGRRVELHVNRRSFEEWRDILDEYVEVMEEKNLHENQRLYLCQAKSAE